MISRIFLNEAILGSLGIDSSADQAGAGLEWGFASSATGS